MSAIQQALNPSFSTADFRAALGTFATGVTVITARDAHGKPVG
ncbi:MAG: flavin reductase, partial [Rhizobacter sp.]